MRTSSVHLMGPEERNGCGISIGDNLRKVFIHFLLIFIGLGSNVAHADQKVMVGEASLSFLLPEFWERAIGYERTQPTLAPSDPLNLAWKRTAINDASGRAIMPGLNITTFHAQQDVGLEMTSVALFQKRNAQIIRFITKDEGLSLPNSLGFVIQQPINAETTLTALVIHAINKGNFVEVILSTTPETWQQVASEFGSIMRSLTFDKDHPPLSLERIESILPPDITIASFVPVPIGAKLTLCVRNTTSGAKFLRTIEEDIGLFRLTNVAKVPKANTWLMQFDLLVYGNSNQLISKQEVTCQ